MDPRSVPFLAEAFALKTTLRRGWLRALGAAPPGPRVESVADHSWGLSLLALALAEERPGLDRARLLETAIVHDLAEATVGDLLPGEYVDRAEKLGRERAALARLLGAAPPAVGARLLARFDEYAGGSTEEARLVRDLDKLEMALQARAYAAQGVPQDRLAEFEASARAAIADRGIAALLG